MIKFSTEQTEKLKVKIKSDILSELESRKVRLDDSDIDFIADKVKSKIKEVKLDQDKIISSLLSQVKISENEKHLAFNKERILTKEVRADFIKDILDKIPIPKDGRDGANGEKGKDGKDYVLTDQDKLDIAGSVEMTGLMKEDVFNKRYLQLIKDIQSGKIKLPSHGGVSGSEIVKKINETLGGDGWQESLPYDGELGANLDYVKFTKDTDVAPDQEGVVDWNDSDYTLNINTGLGPSIQVGQEFLFLVYNGTGEEICNGCVVYPVGIENDRVSVAKANAETHVKITGAVGISTMTIPNGQVGFVTSDGKVRGIDTSTFSLEERIWVAAGAGNDGKFTNTRPTFPDYAIQLGIVNVVDPTNGEITVKIEGKPDDTIVNFFNGTFRETINFTVSSDGATVTGSLEPANGHEDMTMIFSDGFTMLDTSPALTIELTPGTDSNPQTNYIYVPQSTKELTKSTSGWPTTEHIKVSEVLLRTASTTQTDGALRNQNWNDHVQDTNTNQGHLSHVTERIRQEDAKWDTGVQASVIGTPTNVYVSVTSGFVYQLHRQTFPAQSMPTDDIHVVNDSISPYVTATNLNGQILDANGDALSNRSFSFVIWGVVNRTGQTSHIMCNLPSGSYARLAPDLAVEDASNYSVYSIPKSLRGVGFLIARLTFQLDAGGTQWTLYDNQDLRGYIPNTTAGGGAGGIGVTTWTGLTDTPSTLSAQGIPRVNSGGTVLDFTTLLKSGATQAAAGAVAGEFWRTSGHATLPDNVVLQGV